MEQTVLQQFKKIVSQYPDAVAQLSKNEKGEYCPTTFKTLYEEVQQAAAGFQSLGVTRGETVGIIADNRKEWLICDMGLLALGANDAPRGTDTTKKVLIHILGIPECTIAVLENSHQLEKVLEIEKDLPHLKQIIMLDPADEAVAARAKGFLLLDYSDFMTSGKAELEKDPGRIENEIAQGTADDIATIIFTSGTTGVPKGVMLTNSVYTYQAKGILDFIKVKVGDVWLTILPVWHSFERVIQYVSVLNGSCLAYSKPVGKTLLMDLQTIQPTLMTAVPRIWDALYQGILRNIKAKGEKTEKLFRFFLKAAARDEHFCRILEDRYPDYTGKSKGLDKMKARLGRLRTAPLRALGNKLLFSKIIEKMLPRLRAGVSGGGALQKMVDEFYAAVGIKVLEGYGLTESGPVIGVRDENHPVAGTVGPPFAGTEVKVLDQDGKELPAGERGVLFVKGPQIMKGYYKNDELTGTVLSEDGWLNTGDIAVLSRSNDITLVGRAKDTIVLLGGENVEPVPLESKLKESSYIDNAVVLGQDRKFLSALIVPDFDALEEYAKENNIIYENRTLIGETPEIRELLNQEVADLVSPSNGFSSFERIYQFTILQNHFEVGRELSGKMELLRPKIYELYKKEIEDLLNR